ncbi:DUF4956 domain-containing protein [Clostridium sp. MCC353]|uniref:DUF4956 domain-containing protein n=1 Tax=Clostridium sp. MCC353 TaxID=2592646 RepID=UPI001C00E1B4|nr:DUF4956 domain-containing protein [Clostridium sp. MCC353]MBT9774969.1 DUF4956 domain-containing protein [Clostridium sp. MCC353]
MPFNFQDIFKSSFLENVSAISVLDMVLALVLAFLTGLFIFFIYKKSYAGVMYSASFGVTLIALTMITALLILAVTSNVILSLGMVGALSIVRFRTAIKDPSDIAFLFWAIAAGIVLAAGFIPLAVFGSLLIGLVLLMFSRYKGFEKPYILVVHCKTAENEENAREFISGRVAGLCLKSKSVAPHCIELNYEVRLKDADTGFINVLAELPGVSHTVMVSYNGDYMS